MQREIVWSCWPYWAGMSACVAILWLVMKICGGRWQPIHLRRLHVDQRGGVQSLSFVLTIPVFLMIMLFLVQLSQVVVAKMVVEYAAISAARSAMVWIGANFGQASDEGENQISSLSLVRVEPGSDGENWAVYKVAPNSRKRQRIHLAAVLACCPICPSHDVGGEDRAVSSGSSSSFAADAALPAVANAYLAMAPAQEDNSQVAPRIANKLAYALTNTWVDIEVRHKSAQPPLYWYDIRPYRREFSWNEIGWEDQITVTVIHDFALLPGPGRFLLQSENATGDRTAPGGYWPGFVRQRGNVFVHRLTAAVRLGNEGEKPVKPYVQY